MAAGDTEQRQARARAENRGATPIFGRTPATSRSESCARTREQIWVGDWRYTLGLLAQVRAGNPWPFVAKLARDFEVGCVHGLRRRQLAAAHRGWDIGQVEVPVDREMVPQPESGHAQRAPVDAPALQRVRKTLERLLEGQARVA